MGQETLREKTAKGLFWGALNNGTMQLLNIVIGIFLARLLSPSDYGLVGMLAVFTAIAGALQESGFTSALTNMEHPSDNDYNAVFWFSAFVGWISYTVLFFLAPLIASFFHHPELINLSRFIFASLLFSSLGTTPAAYHFAHYLLSCIGRSGYRARTERLCLLEFGVATNALHRSHQSLAILYHSLATLFSHRLYPYQAHVLI